MRDQVILDNLSTGVLTLDPQMRVTAVNVAAQVMLETSEARCLGLYADKLLPYSSQLLDTFERALASRSPQAARSLSLMLLSGQELHVDLIVTPVVDDDGDPSLVVELVPVERQLRISREKSLSLSQEASQAVIRGLAHEIKNPLGGVRGAAQLLARQLPDEALAEYTNIIIREADRLRDLVDRLLGPKQQLDRQPLNIHEVLEHVRELIAAESGHRVSLVRDYDPSIPNLPGDRGQLIQAVLNIMRNAVQAARDPEHCEIILRSRSQRQFTMGARRHRLVCRVDIIDNGKGIPEDMLHTIFAPMVTGRADGTGLGLTIAHSIISRHGGILDCESQPGETRFTIYLPME